MKTEVLPAADPGAIHHAADVLRHGGLVAFPTDTVYGVGALAFNSEAVERLYPVKGRSAEKAIAVLIASPDHLPKIAADMSAEVKLLAAAFWPGALTLVVAKRIE
ncbi:MAG: Sua5/YciO/YrdC/YwlC family protein, partial [Chloroflexi bacterium]|nr:Sua5/YciO/YrdC/YwlC family protein [Chloroflexota bacterium]